LEFQQKAGDEKGTAQTYTYMGMARIARNEPNLALDFYQKALPIQLASGDKRALAITLDKLATSNGLLGNATEASINYAKALELWRAIKDPDGEALTLHNIAVAESAAGNFGAANQNAEASIKLVESLRTRLSSEGLRASYLANKENYYELDVDLKMQRARYENREDYVVAALESNEKSRARVLLEALNQAGVGRAEFNQSSDPRLAGLIEQRLRLVANLGAKANARTRLLSKDHTSEQIAAVDKDISDLSEQYDELEGQVRTQSPRFAALTKPQPATAKEIQQQLDHETLFLEYSLGDRRSYVWVVAPDSIQGFELKGRKEIEATAERMNKALIDRNRNGVNDSPQQIELHRDRSDAEYSKAAAELSKLVIQPVAALLGNKRLVIVADGALQLVSFGALPDPNGATLATERTVKARTPKRTGATNELKPLLENHEIVYEASASVLALQRKEFGSRQPARHALAVLADPVFDQQGFKLELENRRNPKAREGPPQPGPDSTGSSRGANTSARSDLTRAIDDMGIGSISSLPQSREEADGIMKLVPKGEGMEALGFDASRATVMSANLSQYRIIHFATHGFADLNHPELSGIVLSLIDAKGQSQDGYLRLHDIYDLNLPADLVVLSACQTGVGKQIRGEGLIALTRGFTYAGAASVVASLWKVDDEATKILMEEFYKQMFRNGLKPAAALQKAQVKLAHQSSWHSPFYWAGFVLQGEWK
jgi:CHAT domain-containing protein